MTVRLTLACGDYDRTRPLTDGSVRPLAAITRYAFEQGLIPAPLEPWELFAPETLEDTII